MAETKAGDIYAALKTTWSAAAGVSGLLNGLNGPYRGRAKVGTSMPYCTFHPVSNNLRFFSSDSEYWDGAFMFRVFAPTAEAVSAWIGKIGAVFDPAELSLAAGTGQVLQLRRISETYLDDAGGGDNAAFANLTDKNVSMGVIVYRADRSKDRTG